MLAASVPGAVLLAGFFPPAALVVAVVVPAASIAWALTGGSGAWLAAMAPGAAAVAFTAPEGLAAFGATILAGPLVARLRAMGSSPTRALVWGALPFAAWTLGLALSGFDPFPAGTTEALEEFWREGGLPPERIEELRVGSGAALDALRRTWVGSEIVWFWVTLAAAWWLLGRLELRSGQPGQGRFSGFDLPDAWVGALIAGLAMVLAGGFGGPEVVGTAGWNLVFASGFVFVVRGVAIESFWMERAGWRRIVRAAVLIAGFGFALPLFLATATGLGLFDAWFDFRRLRDGAPPPETAR